MFLRLTRHLPASRSLAILLATLLGGPTFVSAASPPLGEHNLILIVIDALRSDHLGAYGYRRDTSPFIDEIASQGVLFESARSNSSFTRQSVASLLTGRLPSCIGAVGWSARPPAESFYLPRAFRSQGFATGFFTTSVVFGDAFSSGFDESETLAGSWDTSGLSPQLVQRALGFVERERASRFFLYIHFLDPHAPYVAGPADRARFDVPVPAKPLRLYRDLLPNFQAHVEQGFGPESDEFVDLVARYDAEIAHVDRSLRSLFAGLSRLGVGRETLVVLTADHGEEFLEHGFIDHGWTLYEESVRVPLIFWAPDRLSPSRVREEVSLVDVAPTLVQLLLGKSSVVPFDGRPLAAVSGEPLESTPPGRAYVGELLIANRNVVRTFVVDHVKYIAAHRWLTPYERPAAVLLDGKPMATVLPLWGETRREWVYALDRDPAERSNVAPGIADQLESLRARLAKLRLTCGKPGVASVPVQPPTGEELEALRALGYIE